MMLTITQAHIDEATANTKRPDYQTCYMCVVAVALSEAVGKPVRVGVVTAYTGDGNGRPSRLWRLSSELSYYIEDFDNGLPVRPATFELTEVQR